MEEQVTRKMTDELPALIKSQAKACDELRPAVGETVAALDFGKLRISVIGLSDSATLLGEEFIDHALADPVSFANLFSMIVPLVNNELRLLAHLLEQIDLPDEILASSVFNMLGDLDTEQIARALNALAVRLNEIHRGSMILGRDEPRLRKVLTEFGESLMNKFDHEQLAAASLALAEDLEVALKVSNALLASDPKLLQISGNAALAFGSATLSGMAGMLRAIEGMPEDELTSFLAGIGNEQQVESMAEALNAALALVNRFAALNKDDNVTAGLVERIDRQQLELAACNLTQNQALQNALNPEQVGKWLNARLTSFNSRAKQGDDRPPGYFRQVFDQLDSQQLEQALNKVLRGATDALLSSPKRAAALIRPLLAAGWRIVTMPLRRLVRRVWR
ncbi:MAG: hypothetical protein P9M14_17130 [Candidatus Alcyoniella australis]|nr:hypothetical protein [Candidatus Alcyoniella australis]